MGLGLNGLFMIFFNLSLLFPLVQIGLAIYTYTSYSACSAVAATTYWDGSTTPAS
jgi:hypothetical protein